MITDQQVRRLRRLDLQGLSKERAADKAGIDAKTARKYRRLGKLPSEVQRMERDYRTRLDPFAEVWPELEAMLRVNPGLEAKTLFVDLQRRFPGRFGDGQLRTLQRRIRQWQALHGPAKEVFFAQVHQPGRLGASDFTHCGDLGVTIAGAPFPHLLYHFVLTYSNWETGTVCFAESYESLSEGLQNALWELGGVPECHRTDRLTAAIPPGTEGSSAFTARYQGLLKHYGLQGQAIQAGQANENGDAEQSHRQFKRALDQALMLRGSRDFGARGLYEVFVRQIFAQCNAGRQERFAEEAAVLRALPERRLESCQRLTVRVDRGSTIHVRGNTYSVASRLIGERVEARLYAERVEVWYGQRQVDTLPRLRGRGKHRIEYRHVIDWLVRKPGAFADYRYRQDLFPSSRFRQAFDVLLQGRSERASREYLQILHLAARHSESEVEAVLTRWLAEGKSPSASALKEELQRGDEVMSAASVTVARWIWERMTPFSEARRRKMTALKADVREKLTDCLKDLHLPAFRSSYEELARQAQQESLSYEQYLLGLAERECQERQDRRTERLLRDSRLPLEKSWPALDLKRLPAKVVQQARSLLEGTFVGRRENVLAFGVPGSGKTHLLCAIGQELVRSGRKVQFWSTGLLVQELLVAKRDLKLSRVLKRLSGYEVLILDDLGYVQQSREEMEVLFTLLAERYERGSVMLTSNLPFSGWESIFKDAMTTAAAIDRLVHHCVIVELNIPSYRAEQAKKAKQGRSGSAVEEDVP